MKHFAVNNVEAGRQHLSAIVDERNLFDYWFPHWKAAFMEGKAQSVMCVYNSVYGVPGCASPFLMEDKLRKDWGFQGYVVSDCGAAANIFNSHHYRPTAEAGAKGKDMAVETRTVRRGEIINLRMAPGGGFAIRLAPR